MRMFLTALTLLIFASPAVAWEKKYNFTAEPGSCSGTPKCELNGGEASGGDMGDNGKH